MKNNTAYQTHPFALVRMAVAFLIVALGATPVRSAYPTATNALSPETASPSPVFANSLGMRFISVPGVEPYVSVWTTRVRDFAAFVAATGYDATREVYSLKLGGGWELAGRSWQSPGFAQSSDYPVVGVSWDDAHAFCSWLTKNERGSETIGPRDEYRLPTDEEWSRFAGLDEAPGPTPSDKGKGASTQFVWGESWPPPPGAGNFAGEETKDAFAAPNIIDGYHDGYAYTSPVGTFAPNKFGLFDVGGNVWQWCEDWYDATQTYRVMRGAGFYYGVPAVLALTKRDGNEPNGRGVLIGFRVVFVRNKRPANVESVTGACPFQAASFSCSATP